MSTNSFSTDNTSNILALNTPVELLLRAFAAHVRGRYLPMPLALGFDIASREISVLPEGTTNLATQLGNVLAWARTLRNVTAKWWRTDGDRIHISIRGITKTGVALRVYGGGHFAECLGGVQLAPNETAGVTVSTLHAFLSSLGDERQHEREVA